MKGGGGGSRGVEGAGCVSRGCEVAVGEVAVEKCRWSKQGV